MDKMFARWWKTFWNSQKVFQIRACPCWTAIGSNSQDHSDVTCEWTYFQWSVRQFPLNFTYAATPIPIGNHYVSIYESQFSAPMLYRFLFTYNLNGEPKIEQIDPNGNHQIVNNSLPWHTPFLFSAFVYSQLNDNLWLWWIWISRARISESCWNCVFIWIYRQLGR